MKWSYLFEPVILKRGKMYYSMGRVSEISRQGGIYRAIVEGTHSYHVSAEFDNGKLTTLGCNCPYAHDGNFCKHMAALLFAVEDIENAEKEAAARAADAAAKTGSVPAEHAAGSSAADRSSGSGRQMNKIGRPVGEVQSLVQEFGKEYHYFDYPSIVRSSGIFQDVWEKGIRLAKDEKIRLKGFHLMVDDAMGGREDLKARVDGLVEADRRRPYYDFGHYEVSIWFSRKQLLEMTCSNYRCPFRWRIGDKPSGICPHMAGVLWLAGRYILEHNPGDATDQRAAAFLTDFEESRNQDEEPSDLLLEITGKSRQEPLELEADITGIDRGACPLVSFHVGGEKKFRIRSVSDFVSAVDQERAMTFGTRTTWNLSEERFAKSAKPLLSLIRDEIHDERQRGTEGMRRGKDQLRLEGESMDRFFDWAEGKFLSCRTPEREKILVGFRDRDQTPHFTVKPGEKPGQPLESVIVEGEIRPVCEGRTHVYWFDGHFFNRTSARKIRPLRRLIDMADDDGDVSFRVGRRMLPTFMYDTLPWLEKNGDVTIEDETRIREFLPPETTFAFQLDTLDSGKSGRQAVCRVLVKSGEQVRGLDAANPREEHVEKVVRRYLPELVQGQDNDLYSTGGSDAQLYLLLEEGVEKLLALGEVESTDSFRRLAVRRPAKFSVGVSLSSGLLNFSLSSDEFTQEELAEILGAYQQKKKFYRMKSGDFVRLDDESLEELEKMMQDLHMTPREFVSGKMDIPAYRALYFDKMLENTEGIYAERDSHFRRLIKEFKTVGDADFAIPAQMKDVLRKYQRTGYRWLRTLANYGFGGILADEMGLGKTLQAIAVFEAEREEREGNVPASGHIALVVCPASLVYNWGEEIAKFAPKLKTVLVVGSQAERKEILDRASAPDSDADILVTSYDLLRRDIPDYEEIQFRYQVIDEAQYIKNHTTAAAKAVKLVHSGTRFALTGTPIENRLSELWSIFDYLMPGFLYGYDTFRKLFENPIVKDEDEDTRERLSRMIAPFILRRYKKDVLKDLPDKLEEVRYSQMGSSQRQLYDAQVMRMKQMIGSDRKNEAAAGSAGSSAPAASGAPGAVSGRDRIRILAELTKVREICCDPSLLYENYQGGSAKREACLDLIRSAIDGGHRILVFSAFTSMLALLEEDLRAADIRFYEITGSTPKQERVRLVSEFNSGDTPVFLISLKAGGTGLNLTGADVVIHYDPWWNIAAQNQATDRAHRIGQTRTVTVYKLIIKGSIEEKILNLQEAKKKLADDVLSDEAVGSGSISQEELMELLE